MNNLLRVLGVILVIVGILGFVLPSPLFGLFAVNALHNVIHLVTGLAFFYAGTIGGSTRRLITQLFGIVYLLVVILTFVSPALIAGLIGHSAANTVLHVILTAVALYIGFLYPVNGP